MTAPRYKRDPLKLRVRIPHFLEAEGEGLMPVVCTAALSTAALAILLIALMQFGPVAVTAGESAYGIFKRVTAIPSGTNSVPSPAPAPHAPDTGKPARGGGPF